MKPGITAKLFIAVLATGILITLAMGVAAHISFTRGFLGYLNEQGVERAESLLPALSAAYKQHGNWDFLRRNPRAWFELMRSVRATQSDDALPPGTLPEPDLTGVNLRVTLLDADRRVVIGQPNVGPDAALRAIEVDGGTVGWLAVLPFQRATASAGVRFQERQFRAIWIIGALSVLLAAAVAMWLARKLLAPVKRIAGATHRLAAGDYATRVPVASRDEIGALAEDFNRLAQTLESNEQLRRAFVADISHELRTPLAVMRGELEAIEDGVRPLSAESLKSLQAEVNMLTKLVGDLYDLSLSDVGALAYRKVDVDITEELQLALGTFRARLAAHGITLDAQLPDRPVMILADEARLRQLFHNLLENSLRYTDPGGVVKVSCTLGDHEVQIDFQDSKPAVPEASLSRLFERFYRVEGSRNRASGGAGLGLAICKNIVEAHQGTIAAHASPLGGLWISVTLPLARVQ
jgi:two-component system sensor histidine kinase BaeS